MVICGTPCEFSSVMKSFAPDEMTQSPPVSLVVLLQQLAVDVRESVTCSTSVAVLVEVSMVKRRRTRLPVGSCSVVMDGQRAIGLKTSEVLARKQLVHTGRR